MSLSLGRDSGFPDTELSSESWAGATGGHHLTLCVLIVIKDREYDFKHGLEL